MTHQPTNREDAAAGNENAIRHVAYGEGYKDGKAAARIDVDLGIMGMPDEQFTDLVRLILVMHAGANCGRLKRATYIHMSYWLQVQDGEKPDGYVQTSVLRPFTFDELLDELRMDVMVAQCYMRCTKGVK